MKKTVKGLFLTFMYISLYFVMQVLFSLLIAVVGIAKNSNGINPIYQSDLITLVNEGIKFSVQNIYLSVFFAIITTFLTYLLISVLREKSLKDMVYNKKCGIRNLVFSVITAISSRVAVTGYTYLSQSIKPLKESFDKVTEIEINITGTISILFAGLVLYVLAPIFEEVLFRGIVFYELRRITNITVANILQAVCFAVAHMVLFQSIFAGVVGFLFGIMYMRTKSIRVTMLSHIVFNATAVIEIPTNTVTAIIMLVFATGLAICTSLLTKEVKDV